MSNDAPEYIEAERRRRELEAARQVAHEAYGQARKHFFSHHESFLNKEALHTALYKNKNFGALISNEDFNRKVYTPFHLYLEEIFAEKAANLTVHYPESTDNLSIDQLRTKTSELQEKYDRDLNYFFNMHRKLQALYSDRLQEKIQARIERFQQLFGIDLAKPVNGNPGEFAKFQEKIECAAQLSEAQKDALYLVYMGAAREQKEGFNKLAPQALQETVMQVDSVLSSDKKAVDTQVLAGVCLLQLTNQNQAVLASYDQYKKFADCAKKIDQEWSAYLTKKGVSPDTAAPQNFAQTKAGILPEKSGAITAQDKIDAVQRVRIPFNRPELCANPLQQIKAFTEALRQPENRFLFKHRDDNRLAKASRGALTFFGRTSLSKSQQIASTTWNMAMELEEAKPQRPQQGESPTADSSTPRLAGR